MDKTGKALDVDMPASARRRILGPCKTKYDALAKGLTTSTSGVLHVWSRTAHALVSVFAVTGVQRPPIVARPKGICVLRYWTKVSRYLGTVPETH